MEKILRAINEGVSKALDFNIEDLDSDFSIKKSKVDSKNGLTHSKLDEYVKELEKKCDMDKIVQLHEQYGIIYKPSSFMYLKILVSGFNDDKYDGYDLNWVDVSEMTDMSNLFGISNRFNCNISKWDVSNVINMDHMFSYCVCFNLPLNDWDVSNVTNMSSMFYECRQFNLSLNKWDVSNVTNMNDMFYGCSTFDQHLNSWDMHNVTKAHNMFSYCSNFNLPLNDWNTSNITETYGMFNKCKVFNLPLDKWNVSKIDDMSYMFYDCNSFNLPLHNWDLSHNVNMQNMFLGSKISKYNLPLPSAYIDKDKNEISLEFFDDTENDSLNLIYHILKDGSYKGINKDKLLELLEEYLKHKI